MSHLSEADLEQFRSNMVRGKHPLKTIDKILKQLYRSKLEARYAAHLEILKKAGEIKRWEYEPMSLKLADGKRYRPDFLVVLPMGMEARAELHEVKGKWTKNKRDGMTHLKWAAQRFGDVFTFRLIEWTGHGFDGSYIS